MRKRLLLLMLIAMQSVALMAQEAHPQLVVWLKGGEKAYFNLDKLPETSFGDGLLTIKSSTSTVSYQLANVLRYTYLNVQSTGIDDMPSAYGVKISELGEAVTFRSLKPGTIVRLYSLGGMLLDEHTAQDAQPLTITLRSYPSGAYVVKAANETIKMLKP